MAQRTPFFPPSHLLNPSALQKYERGLPAKQYLMFAPSHRAFSVGSQPPTGGGADTQAPDGRRPGRGAARHATGGAVDAHLVTVEAADGGRAVALLGGPAAGVAARRATGGAVRRRGALQAEGGAVEADELALLALQLVRARGGALRLVAVLDVAGARPEHARGVAARHDALLAAARAVAHLRGPLVASK